MELVCTVRNGGGQGACKIARRNCVGCNYICNHALPQALISVGGRPSNTAIGGANQLVFDGA